MLTSQLMSMMVFEYLLILKILTSVKLRLIRTTMPSRSTYYEWRQIVALSDKFEKRFSLIPFFKITNGFNGIITYIVFSYIQNVPMTLSFKLSVIYLGVQQLIDIYFIFAIDQCNEKLKEAVNIMLQKLSMCYNTDGTLEQYANEVNQSYRFNLTGYGLFNLEKSLIIGFISSLISFTVLFIQITTM